MSKKTFLHAQSVGLLLLFFQHEFPFAANQVEEQKYLHP